MDFEETVDWGALHKDQEQNPDLWCLTEELFEKFSLRKVLCEQDKEKVPVPEKPVGPPIPQPRIPFPRISNLSIEDQTFFSEAYKDYISGKDINLENINRLQTLMWTLKSEQEEFSAFLQQHSLLLKEQYNFVHPQVKATVQNMLVDMRSRVQDLAPCYTLFQTVSLSSGAVFPNDPILRFDRVVKQAKGQALLRLPTMESNIKLLPARILSEVVVVNQTELCQDSTVRDILAEHDVQFVLTADALQALIDNHPPDYEKDWQLPLSVIDQPQGDSKNTCSRTILIEDPLPPRSMTPREMNVLFFKRQVCELLNDAQSGIEPMDNKDPPGVSCLLSDISSQNKPSDVGDTTVQSCGKGTIFENLDGVSGQNIDVNHPHTKLQFSHEKHESDNLLRGEDCAESSSVGSGTTTKNEGNLKENVPYSYSLWTFGNLKLLIRSSDNGLLYQSKEGEKGLLYPVNVFVKPEYQLPFGYEKVTSSEASRMWLKSYINPNSLCVCARVDSVSCELLRLDVLSQAAIINLSSFNAAQPMKTVHNVLTRLSKLLESTGKFISSHSSRDMHTCIYEMMNDINSQEAKKASYDLHAAYSCVEEAVVLKNYEKSLPWVSLDPNMFVDWHITHARLPMTFPAVANEELKKKKDAESGIVKKAKKNKKKKTAKAAPKEHKNPKTSLNYLSRRSLRNANRVDTDKPIGVSDDAPAAPCDQNDADTKLFERLRGKSKPTTYNDFEFDF